MTYELQVKGHLELRKSTNSYYWHIKLSWYEEEKRRRKSIPTKLPEKSKKNTRNKGKANEMLLEAVKNQEALLKATVEDQEDLSTGQPDGNILFADFISDKWLKVVRRGDRKATKKVLELTTFSGYQANVEVHIAPYFHKKSTLLVELIADDINDFYDFHFDAGKSGTTIVKYHANIVSSLKYAAKVDLIPSADNILKNVIRPVSEDFIAKPYVEAEAMELVEKVKGHLKLELPVILCVYYGLRRSEIVGLRWSSIDFDANQITIEHTVKSAKIDGKRQIYVKDNAKSKSSLRTLTLIPILREKLLAAKAEQEFNRKLCGRSYNRKREFTSVLMPLAIASNWIIFRRCSHSFL